MHMTGDPSGSYPFTCPEFDIRVGGVEVIDSDGSPEGMAGIFAIQFHDSDHNHLLSAELAIKPDEMDQFFQRVAQMQLDWEEFKRCGYEPDKFEFKYINGDSEG